MTDEPSTVAYGLSEDRCTLVIVKREPAGIRTMTLTRQSGAGPFNEADVAYVLGHDSAPMQPGQRNKTRRAVTRFGTLWTHVMLGPPTWWKPKARHEQDGTVMAGWLRFAVAVRFDRGSKVRRSAALNGED